MTTLPPQQCQVNGVNVLVDLIGMRRAPVSALREAQDQGVEPGEQTLMPTAQWKRSMVDWVQGAGQEYYDDPFEGDRRRFRVSRSTNVWTRRALSLLPVLTSLDPESDGYDPGANLMSVGDRIYTVQSGDMRFYNDVVVGSTWTNGLTTVTGSAMGNIIASTTDGTRVWFSDGLNIKQTNETISTYTQFSEVDVDMLAYGAGRLMGAKGPILYDLDASGAGDVVWTHPNPDWRWTNIATAPNATYAFGGDGIESAIYSIEVDETNGELGVPVLAAPLPRREAVTALAFYAGVAVIGTSKGIRTALVGSNNELQFGPRIENVVPAGGINQFAVDAEFVYFPMHDATFGSLAFGVGRLNLARSTADLVPAYASDVRVVDSSDGDMLSIIFHGDRLVVGTINSIHIGGLYPDGVWYLNDTAPLAAQASVLISGRVTYGTAELKRYDSISVKTQPLPGLTNSVQPTVKVSVLEDDGTKTLVLTINTPGSLGGRAAIPGSVSEEWVEVVVEITGAPGLLAVNSPVVERVTLVGTPTPFRVEELLLPVIMSSTIVDANGRLCDQDPLALLASFTALMQSRATITVVLGGETLSCYVDGVVLEGNNPAASLYKFEDMGRGIEGIVLLKLVTVEPTS